MPRLFLAVRPPEKVIDELAALPRPAQDRVRWTAPRNWHVTLRFLGETDADDVVAAVAPVMPPPPARIELGPAVTTLGRAVVVPAAGLDHVAAELAAATIALGDDDRPFVGHLTLAYRRAKRTSCSLIGTPFQASFPLEAVELMASDPAPNHQYSTVHRWPVADAR